MSAISADAPSWYAVRTSSRAEKRIVCRLKEKGIEAYVPLRVEKKKWSDRIKTVETPLITCYVFVRVASGRMIDVLRTQGVVGPLLLQTDLPIQYLPNRSKYLLWF